MGDKRPGGAQDVAHVHEVGFRCVLQRLGAHHGQILLEENVPEQVGFRLYFSRDALDKLPVFLNVVAFHDHHQIVRLRELLLQREVILVVFLVRAHQVVSVHIRLQKKDGEGDAG